ncbi:unnamed protein product, partial [Strongylus vulgaris]
MPSAITVEDGVALGVVDKPEVSSEEERLLVLMFDVPLSVSVVPDAALVVCWSPDSGIVTSNEDVLVVLPMDTSDVVLPAPATPPVEEEVLAVLVSDNATDGELPFSPILFGLEVIVTSEEDGSVVLISILDGELPIPSVPFVGDVVLVALVRDETSGGVEAIASTLLELEEMVTSEEGVLLIVLCDSVLGVAVTSGIGLLVLLAPIISVVTVAVAGVALGDVVTSEDAILVVLSPGKVLSIFSVLLRLGAVTSGEGLPVISSVVVPAISSTFPEEVLVIPVLDDILTVIFATEGVEAVASELSRPLVLREGELVSAISAVVPFPLAVTGGTLNSVDGALVLACDEVLVVRLSVISIPVLLVSSPLLVPVVRVTSVEGVLVTFVILEVAPVFPSALPVLGVIVTSELDAPVVLVSNGNSDAGLDLASMLLGLVVIDTSGVDVLVILVSADTSDIVLTVSLELGVVTSDSVVLPVPSTLPWLGVTPVSSAPL